MKTLSDNWFAEGLVDFEYKKYLLLAYLQHAKKEFDHVKLYPVLGDLIKQHQTLSAFQKQKSNLNNAFPKKLTGTDISKLKLNYEKLVEDGEMMQELEQIIEFAIPKLKSHIESGKDIYNFIEQHLEIESVGLTPIYQREGYVLLTQEKDSQIYIYRYEVSLFQYSMDKFRSILLKFVKRVNRSLVNTIEQIKLDLARTYQELPNPATWRIHSRHQVPLDESLIPISKRLLLQHIP
ncbi:hypothetical protein KIH41_15565 [Litoribacter ruber]|uniref:Uncharacterized protein n=1 Tax=Litoribacter ruber TaxID=702568 RepID=A0AAP2CHA2_9BACT|nr:MULTISPECIES: hypothetical protein [Litoribacter]MBS9524686.1 hypothetical protein [Litoribacter alkaliphilus]MBT0812706.1 hypothetical protein [Litoribacter ruber]